MKHHSVHLENGVTIPKGVAACVWLHAAHRDPAAWESPNTFKPSLVRNPCHRFYDDDVDDDANQTEKNRQKLPTLRFGSAFMRRPTCRHGYSSSRLWPTLGDATLSENKRECPIQDEMVPSVGFTIAPQFGARVNVSEH